MSPKSNLSSAFGIKSNLSILLSAKSNQSSLIDIIIFLVEFVSNWLWNEKQMTHHSF